MELLIQPVSLRETLEKLSAGLNSVSDSAANKHEQLEKRIKEQESVIAEQKDKLKQFAGDRSVLQTSQLVARDALRKSEKARILAKHNSLAVKEKLDVYMDLGWEVQDIFESWEGILPPLEDLLQTEGTFEGDVIDDQNIEEANIAVKATAVMLTEIFRRLKKEKQITEATSASVAGLGIKSLLENKHDKFSGTTEENEELAQRVKAAEKEYFLKNPHKKKSLNNAKNNFKYGATKTFAKPAPYKRFQMDGYNPRSYNKDQHNQFKGQTGPSNFRTCYRCKKPGHMIRDCPMPDPLKKN